MSKTTAVVANSVFMVIALAMLMTACGNSDPVRSHTEWRGRCFQMGYGFYPMIMTIDDRRGSEIYGILHWPTLGNSRTRFKGSIEGEELSLTEYELVEGTGVVVPTVYDGQLVGESISGTWTSPDYPDEGGTFQIDKTEQE